MGSLGVSVVSAGAGAGLVVQFAGAQRASFRCSNSHLDLPKTSGRTPTPTAPRKRHRGRTVCRRVVRKRAENAGVGGPPTLPRTHFYSHIMAKAATTAQIWHEMKRRGAGDVTFTLTKDKSSPYRARGVPVFTLCVTMSWRGDRVTVIDDAGNPLLLTWAQFSAALPEIASASASVMLKIVVQADAVAWAQSDSRDAKRTSALLANVQAWPDDIDAIRSEWMRRNPTARRTRYLAAADALESALRFP